MRTGKAILLLVAVGLFMGLSAPAEITTNTLVWNKKQGTIDADISSWNIRQLMEHVAASTGWKVYLDPGAIHAVSVKFKETPSGEALQKMLGNVNFILVPETNSPWRLYVFRTSRQQATQLVAPPRKIAKPIPNELVVRMKPGSKGKIDELARSLNAKIIGRMDAQGAYLLQFADDAATQFANQQLANNADVAGIENNYPMEPPPSVAAANGNTPNLQLNPPASSNNKLIVGLIDTPVQPLAGNLNSFMLPEMHVAGDAELPADQLTHGTAMAETILESMASVTGSSSYVQILPVDVYGNNTSTTTFDVANGIAQAINAGANPINLSLGGTGDSPILHQVIDDGLEAHITFYAAAGNEPVTTPTYPAAYQGVNAVGAVVPGPDGTPVFAPYSNRGSFIDTLASGTSYVPFDGQTWQVEGTSSAAANATGRIAGILEVNNAPASQAPAYQSSLPHSSIAK